MIPHTSAPFPLSRKTLLENTKSPAAGSDRSVASGSAELVCHQGGDFSTEVFGGLLRFSFRQHPYEGLGARQADEDPAGAVELLVHALDRRDERLGQRAVTRARQVLPRLREARHDRDRLREAATVQRAAEEEAGDEAVS